MKNCTPGKLKSVRSSRVYSKFNCLVYCECSFSLIARHNMWLLTNHEFSFCVHVILYWTQQDNLQIWLRTILRYCNIFNVLSSCSDARNKKQKGSLSYQCFAKIKSALLWEFFPVLKCSFFFGNVIANDLIAYLKACQLHVIQWCRWLLESLFN